MLVLGITQFRFCQRSAFTKLSGYTQRQDKALDLLFIFQSSGRVSNIHEIGGAQIKQSPQR